MKRRHETRCTFARQAARITLCAAALSIAGTGFAKAPKDSSTASTTRHHWYQIGKASWYGSSFNGKRTATGEKFDANGLTCAHRTLPLGSWVRVTNLVNKKALFLRVNDRGPVPESRIVDLSYAAAKKLGISGLGNVKVESVEASDVRALAPVRPTAPGTLQLASVNADGFPVLPSTIAIR